MLSFGVLTAALEEPVCLKVYKDFRAFLYYGQPAVSLTLFLQFWGLCCVVIEDKGGSFMSNLYKDLDMFLLGGNLDSTFVIQHY